MRKFGIIGSRIWRSDKFGALDHLSSKLVYIYLHSCIHGNSAGCFHISPTIVSVETGLPLDEARTCLADLVRVGLIRHDEDQDLIQLVGFFRFNRPTSRKQAAGPLQVADEIPRGPIRDAVRAELAICFWETAKQWGKEIEARGIFLDHASKLMRTGGISAIESGFVTVENDDRIGLSEDLLISLSPVASMILDTDTNTDTDRDREMERDIKGEEEGKGAKTPDTRPAPIFGVGRAAPDDVQKTIRELTAKATARKK